MAPGSPSADRLDVDPASQGWLDALRAQGRLREDAIARLHALLLRAARFEVARRRASLRDVGGVELDAIALQSADDALVAVLAKLDQFRGASRFETWAYKFALLEAAVAVRRRRWQGREIPLEPADWLHLPGAAQSLESAVEQRELLDALTLAIRTELTPHQREVLVAVAVQGVPIDVLAERLATTRGALYKTIHDARQRLRRRLAAQGYGSEQGAAW
jgi:RNA polymerase sigma-70 factor (ECF subfamily)